jgi:hypothetical protein
LAGVTALQDARAELDGQGWTVLRGVVAPERVSAALRLLHLEIRRCGLTAEQIVTGQSGTFFPHLRWEPAVWDVLPDPAAELLGWQQGDDWAEPQILLRFPDEQQDWPLEPHVDELPPWGREQRYRGIVGVALTTAGAGDGAACVWPGSHRGEPGEPVPVPLTAGDALVMHPLLGHSGTLNLGHTVRTAVYFRLLTPAG